MRSNGKSRNQMKAGVVLLVVGSCVFVAGVSGARAKEKWRLGTQAWSFNLFAFAEAVAKTESLYLKYMEAYPGQRLSAEAGDAKLDHNMSAEQREIAKKMLKDAGLALVNYGVVALPNNEMECRKVFDFAKDMGIETIVSQPAEDAFELIDKLCNEYQIGVAIHNHPKPSPYWNYETVLKVCEGRSQWIGACADTGHWTRSQIDPLVAVKALGKAGRIRSLHFKDLSDFSGGAYDVPWGTGVSKAREVLAELAAQNFEGVFSIEYEYKWDNNVPEIRKCVEWFTKTAAELSSTPAKDIFKMPIVDFNSDGKVDIQDLLRLIESWGKDDPSMDVGPVPWGDGKVDEKDLEVLMSYWGQEVDDPTLVAHWKLDEADGTIATDSAGTSDGVLVGDPIWQPAGGNLGGALQLDGVGDCVATESAHDFSEGAFSVLAWVRGGAPGQVIVSQQGAANWLMTDAGGKLMTELKPPRRGEPLAAPTVITDGQWHQVGLTWDGSRRALYVDGVEVARDAKSLTGLAASTEGLYLGAGGTLTPGTFWSGLIDDVRIYDRAVKP